MSEVLLNQGVTRYCDEGTGEPIVLIHGMGLDLTLWDQHALNLSKDFRIIRFDMLGHGQSAAPPSSWGIEQHTAQIAELLDHLAVNDVVLLGFSLGGTVAQCFTLDYPDRVRGLIVVASVCARNKVEQEAVEARLRAVRDGGPNAVADGAIERWFTADFQAKNPALVAHWHARLKLNAPRSYTNAYEVYARADADFRHRLPAIQAPTLIMTGELDAGQNPRMARAMCSLIPNSSLIIVPDVAHMLPLEASDVLQIAVRDFMLRSEAHKRHQDK